MTLVFPASIFRCKLLVWGWVSKNTLQTWGFRNHSIPQIHRWTKEGATQRDHRREAKRIWWFTGWRGLGEKMVECFAGFFPRSFSMDFGKTSSFWFMRFRTSSSHHSEFLLLLFPALPLIRKTEESLLYPGWLDHCPNFFQDEFEEFEEPDWAMNSEMCDIVRLWHGWAITWNLYKPAGLFWMWLTGDTSSWYFRSETVGRRLGWCWLGWWRSGLPVIQALHDM